ncbi:MAG: protein tyrosine phosphatase [Legionellaceae bacterium]|nr:protein tyrosine phosphatase [Legionellaceae bacterium]
MRYSFCLFMLLICSSSSAEVISNPVILGDTKVEIIKERNGPGKSFIHVHQNESTALKAAQIVVKQQGGSIITLKHKGGRNIKFNIGSKHYEFDPNRIFSKRGIKNTLSTYGAYSLEAHKLVKGLANSITKLIPKGKVIAVHNNQSYSLKDYLPGRSLEDDVERISYSRENSYRNFYLLTNKLDYKRLTDMNFNSVLQSQNAEDDGSLSIFLINRDYINVEAGYDQLTAQIDMLKKA